MPHLPPKLAADHEQLMSKMDMIKSMKDTWETDKSVDNASIVLSQVNKAVFELKEILFEHIAEEEQIIPGLLKDHFTFEEDKAIVGRIFEESGPEYTALGMPWVVDAMFDWGGKGMVQGFMAGMPEPVQQA